VGGAVGAGVGAGIGAVVVGEGVGAVVGTGIGAGAGVTTNTLNCLTQQRFFLFIFPVPVISDEKRVQESCFLSYSYPKQPSRHNGSHLMAGLYLKGCRVPESAEEHGALTNLTH
jgi:hypothetical protein